MDGGFRFIDAAEVYRLLEPGVLVDHLAEAHRGPPPLIGRSLLVPPDGVGTPGEGFLVLPAWAHGRAFGVKMVTILPGNAEIADGPPAVQAVYQLFEGVRGQPVAAIDGTALTHCKTAADSALGARLLARADVRTLVMIGAGALAPHLVRAHVAVRPSLERVLVWNRSPGRRDRLLGQLAEEDLPVEAAADLEAAVRQPTWSRPRPCRPSRWFVVPGSDPAPMSTWSVAISRTCARPTTRRSAGPRSTSTSAARPSVRRATSSSRWRAACSPRATSRATCSTFARTATRGRQSENEITLYKNGGGSHLDLFSAELLVGRLRA